MQVEHPSPLKSNQTSIKKYLSPIKPTSTNLKAEPITPNKLSQELSDSMKLSETDEWMTELNEDWNQGKTDSCLVASPDKRKAVDETTNSSSSKLFKENNAGIKLNAAKKILEFSNVLPQTSKRPALVSPSTFRTNCHTESPRSYPPGTSSRQPIAYHFNDMDDDDSFADVDLSLVEEQAIISSQRKLNADVFGSDEDDDFEDDGVSDDELADVIRQSQTQAK